MIRKYLDEELIVTHPDTLKEYKAKLFKPDRNTLGNYINQMNGILQIANPFIACEQLLNNCFDPQNSDSEILTEDELYIPAVNKMKEIIKPLESKTDKNEDGTYTITIMNEDGKEFKIVVNKINRIIYSKVQPILGQKNLIAACEIMIRELMISDLSDKEILENDDLYIPACLQILSIFNVGSAVLLKKNVPSN